MTTSVERAELKLTRDLARFRHHPAVKRLEPLSKAADQPPMLAGSAAVVAAGLLLRRPRLAEAGARALAAVLLATGLKAAVKAAVRRTRPHKALARGRYRSDTGGSDDKGEQSFPSGHTADAVAAARAAVRVFPAAGPYAYALAAAVAALQPAQAKHYPSDVAAGAVIGVAAEAATAVLAYRLMTLISPLRSR
jgi:membrane-associated phospholipid phosphatase